MGEREMNAEWVVWGWWSKPFYCEHCFNISIMRAVFFFLRPSGSVCVCASLIMMSENQFPPHQQSESCGITRRRTATRCERSQTDRQTEFNSMLARPLARASVSVAIMFNFTNIMRTRTGFLCVHSSLVCYTYTRVVYTRGVVIQRRAFAQYVLIIRVAVDWGDAVVACRCLCVTMGIIHK